MAEKTQCPAHTRTPWGQSDHRYDHRIRYLFMGILCVAFLAAAVHSDDDVLDLDLAKPVILKTAHNNEDGAPFYPPVDLCGNHLHDCQAYFKPNFCCPPLQVCRKTKWSPSGIYCCAMSDECIVSEEHPATCAANTTQCGRELGGGCCPEGTTCSPDGCLETAKLDKHLRLPAMNMSGHVAPEAVVLYGRQSKTETNAADDAVFTGTKFGEVGLVKTSDGDTLLTPHLYVMLHIGLALPFLAAVL
ncbi:hypothetical protein FDECE_9026 [Fusarium decemcellulare]|nr:hypothetical protein FDECE_9026 [Fusarium decemcellulare]